ncbi:MAG: hypothetical protein KDJ35_00160 [Alphaproteobacteria bacterium]|nr:hypothetical protein [Alphaproteobacteria bacterium]
MGNQIANYAHLYVYYLEHRDRLNLLMLSFIPYRRFFSGMPCFCMHGQKRVFSTLLGVVFSVWPYIKKTRPSRMVQVVNRISKPFPFIQSCAVEKKKAGEIFDLSKEKIGIESYYAPYVLLSGWPVRCMDLIEKHEKDIRKLFQFHPSYEQGPKNLISALRKKYDYIVGVQIRQTDYASFNGGVYYYEAEHYLKLGLDSLDHYASKGRVAVVYVSDEKQDRSLFDHPDLYFGTGAPNGPGHYFEDFILLTLCNIVISPPSTFTAFAAFIGDVAWIPLMSKTQDIQGSVVLERALFDIPKISGLDKVVQ